MKTATIPSIRVEPAFREQVESVLAEGESLSEFVEAAILARVQRRHIDAEFIKRGLRARDDARRTGAYVEAGAVLRKLEGKLDAARRKLSASR